MIHTNDIINYYAYSTIQYIDLFTRKLPPHTIDSNRKTAPRFCGLVFTLNGSATFSLNGTPYKVNPQTILHAGPSMDIHMETSTECWEYVVIHYEAHSEIQHLQHKTFQIICEQINKISYYVQQLLKYEQLPGALVKIKCQVYLYQLIETILCSIKRASASNCIDQAIQYINENYQLPISISEIAEEVQCDRRRLSYLFEKQIGLSPIQYLTEYRLKQAKLLLRSTQIPINEIADYVGYSDAYYFCKLFKKHYHCTPTQYRKSL